MIPLDRTTWLAAVALAAILPAQGDGFYHSLAPMLAARQELACAELNGLVYAVGGLSPSGAAMATAERFDPVASLWSPIASLPAAVHHHGLAAVGGRVLSVGGYSASWTAVATVNAYDPQANAWTALAPLPQPRGALAAVTLGGRVYAVGGVHPTRGVTGDLTVYDPQANAWTTLPPMPTPREHLAAAALDGRLWVCGGRVGFGTELRTIEVYDPATNAWTPAPQLPVAHGGTGAAALRGRLLVFGGEAPSGIVGEVDEFHPARGTWRRVNDLMVPVHGIYPVRLGDSVVIAGGATAPGVATIGTVQVFSYLPAGITAYGTSTSCGRPIFLGATAAPRVSQAGFRFVTSADLPPSSFGLLALAGAPDPVGSAVLGATAFVQLGPGLVLAGASADTSGVATVVGPSPMPAALLGLMFFAQGGWLPTNACAPLLTSDAVRIVVH